MSDEPGFTSEATPHKKRAWRSALLVSIAVLGVLGTLIYVNRETVGLFVAIAFSESRPDLLRDAEWGKQGSARLFERQFRRGTPATELLSWLSASRFTVDQSGARASRTVASLPCNERIDVTWTADAGGRLTSATAVVHEAGCL